MGGQLLLRAMRVDVLAACMTLAVLTGVDLRAQSRRDVVVISYKYGFRVAGSSTPEIHVMLDDLVRVTFSTEDIPHNFTIDDHAYRIMRRAAPGRPVVFEFRADKAGTFPFRCTLAIDDRCKEMRGWLVVEERRPSSGNQLTS
jgi:heme/copper-type cytochrome/quinol oxidase subunit 2